MKEGWAAEVLMERGVPAPDWIEDEPVKMWSDGFYMKAFHELSTERQLGFTVGPIPMSAIRSYPGLEALSPAMIVLFETVIQRMDSTYRDWAESERKKANKKSTSDKPTILGDGKQTQPK